MSWMAAPLAGCVVSVLILGYLGLHVLRRQVIFVDLALAQIAALGATYAFFLGFPPESLAAAFFSLLFAFAGAALFAVTRAHEGRLPQEAVIGICYVVAAAAVVLLVDLARDPHGAERIRFLLVGSIVWATWTEVGIAAAVCLAVGLVHVVFRRPFEQATSEPESLRAAGQSVMLWDLLFYATFGVAITAIVRLIGVLLVFSYLIIPGAVASLFFTKVRSRLLASWGLGLAVSVVGLLFGYDHPPGPMIVACFGATLGVALIVRSTMDAENRARRGLLLGGGAALTAIVLLALPHLVTPPPDEHHHHEGGEEHAEAEGERGHQGTEGSGGIAAGLDAADGLARQEAIDRLASDPSPTSTAALLAHLPVEKDEELRLRIATALHQRGVGAGQAALEALAASASVPFVQLEAKVALGADGGE